MPHNIHRSQSPPGAALPHLFAGDPSDQAASSRSFVVELRNEANLVLDPHDSVAVVEGGGARAAFAFGAAATFALAECLPKRVFCTSAGALAALFAATGQIAQGARFLSTVAKYIRRRPPVFDTERLVMDLDREGLIRTDLLAEHGFDLRVGTLDAVTGETVFHQLDARAPLAKLAATMALPGFAPSPVAVEGRRYCDGGPGALAVEQAAATGACRGLALLTRPADFQRAASTRLYRLAAPIWGNGLSRSCRYRYLSRSERENPVRASLGGRGGDLAIPWLTVTAQSAGDLPGRYTRDPHRLLRSMRAGASRAAQVIAPQDPDELARRVDAELSVGMLG